jgi:drug/metabolite transporter (DMT)-like permease
MTPSLGLFLAICTSVMNVFTDISRKKALAQNDLYVTTFWIRLMAMLTMSAVFAVRFYRHGVPHLINDTVSPLAIVTRHLQPGETFFVYLLLDTSLVAISALLYFRALQISDLSLSIPFLAFTPAMLVLTGALFLHERLIGKDLLGVFLVVTGSLMMNRQSFRHGLMGPVRALLRNKGSRYMLLVALILSITNPLDKKLVLMSDAVTQAFAYDVLLWLLLAIIAFRQRPEGPWLQPVRSVPFWLICAGLFDAFDLLLQFDSHLHAGVVITITLKRAGIILSVLAGWLIFREKHITDRLMASLVMMAGVVAISFPLSLPAALMITLAAIVFAAALVISRGSRDQDPLEVLHG